MTSKSPRERFEMFPEAMQVALVDLGAAMSLTARPERRVIGAWAEVIGLSTMPPALVRTAGALGSLVRAVDRVQAGPVAAVPKEVRR